MKFSIESFFSKCDQILNEKLNFLCNDCRCKHTDIKGAYIDHLKFGQLLFWNYVKKLIWWESNMMTFMLRTRSSWHSDVVIPLSQRCGWRYYNVLTRLKMRVVATSFSNVVKRRCPTFSRWCHDVATTSPQH